MGEDKALLVYNGKTFIQSIGEILAQLCTDVFIVAEKKKEYEFLHIPVEEDVIKNIGPLGGIHSALTYATTEFCFIVSCDVPFITKELIGYICNFPSSSAIRIPAFNARFHPLCGVYAKKCLPVIEEQIKQNNYRVQNIFHHIPTAIIPITNALPFFTPQLLQNINSKTDYKEILK